MSLTTKGFAANTTYLTKGLGPLVLVVRRVLLRLRAAAETVLELEAKLWHD